MQGCLSAVSIQKLWTGNHIKLLSISILLQEEKKHISQTMPKYTSCIIASLLSTQSKNQLLTEDLPLVY